VTSFGNQVFHSSDSFKSAKIGGRKDAPLGKVRHDAPPFRLGVCLDSQPGARMIASRALRSATISGFRHLIMQPTRQTALGGAVLSYE
jgi:hypothetical protein